MNKIRTVNKKIEKTNTLALPTTFASTFTFTVLLQYYCTSLAGVLYFFVILGVDNARGTVSSRLTDQRPLTFTFLAHASQVSITDISFKVDFYQGGKQPSHHMEINIQKP